jgi:hypothetical protein
MLRIISFEFHAIYTSIQDFFNVCRLQNHVHNRGMCFNVLKQPLFGGEKGRPAQA